MESQRIIPTETILKEIEESRDSMELSLEKVSQMNTDCYVGIATAQEEYMGIAPTINCAKVAP